MGFDAVILKPGINVEATPTALRAGFFASAFVRFRNGFIEKLGGWIKFFPFALAGVPRAMAAWLDLNGNAWLAVGTTQALDVISSNVLTTITPTTLVTNSFPSISTTASSTSVIITDPNILNVTTYDSVVFNTPVAVGGIVLSGLYPLNAIDSSTSYTIIAATAATETRVLSTITGITQANPAVVTAVNDFTNGDLVYIYGVVGMTQVNGNLYSISAVSGSAFTLTGINSTGFGAYSSGGFASEGATPEFTTVNTSAIVTVTFSDHGLSAGSNIVFPIPTTVGGLTIQGNYTVIAASDTDNFTIAAAAQATSSAVALMNTSSATVTISIASPAVVTWTNHGLVAGTPVAFSTTGSLPTGMTAGLTYYVLATGLTANTFEFATSIGGSAINTSGTQSGVQTGTQQSTIQFNYQLTVGPPSATGTTYSFGGYSSGPYSGTGSTAGAPQTGTPITATDWTLDNWAATLMACPAGGGIYQWTPGSGVQQAQLIGTAPPLNSGIFVASPYQILIAYGSTITRSIGVVQDPLTWRASDISDYTFWQTNVVNPGSGATSQALQNRIPTGSKIVAGMATPQQVLLWTDLDLWSLQYVNLPLIWTQTKIGANYGAVSRHSVAQMGGVVYWMGRFNFHALAGGAPIVIPCTVWDQVFQDLDTNNLDKCWTEPNQGFNEIFFFFPSSSGGTGQCDSCAKVNIIDGSWDYVKGNFPRSAGIPQSVLGNPIMATPTGVIYQHEIGYNNDTQPMLWSWQTGYFYINEGEDFVTVTKFFPDMKFTTASASTPAAAITVTFSVLDYPSDTPKTYTYTFMSTTEWIDVRFRGRQFSITMSGNDINSWNRVGHPRFLYQLTGRR